MGKFRFLVAFGCLVSLLLPMAAFGSEPRLTTLRLTNETLFLRSHGGIKYFAAEITAPTQLKVVLAHDEVDGPRETVQSMCRRYHCLAAINGDFFGGKGPHGAIVSRGHVFRTAHSKSGEVWLGSSLQLNSTQNTNLIAIDMPGKHFDLPLNMAADLHLASVYSSTFGGTINVLPHAVINVFQCVCHSRPDIENESYRVKLIRQMTAGQMPKLRANQIAIQVLGSDATWFAQNHPGAAIVHIPEAVSDEAIGAHPMLMTHGHLSGELNDTFATSLHPRSVIARNAAGKIWIIAIDTRVSLPRAAQIAKSLGATEAINLDGGGSTTFVVRGRTVNNPADKAERAVASAILVVPITTYHAKISTRTHHVLKRKLVTDRVARVQARPKPPVAHVILKPKAVAIILPPERNTSTPAIVAVLLIMIVCSMLYVVTLSPGDP